MWTILPKTLRQSCTAYYAGVHLGGHRGALTIPLDKICPPPLLRNTYFAPLPLGSKTKSWTPDCVVIQISLSYLFIADVFRVVSGRFLHGSQAHDLEQVVLHYVTNDPKLVKVPTATHGPKRLLERHHDVGNVVSVPYRLEDSVGKPDFRRKVGERKEEMRGSANRCYDSMSMILTLGVPL